jgi:hypothetical protein
VIAYNDALSTATIELAFQSVEDDESGNEVLREAPIIPDVMVWHFGGQESYVRLPLAPGDTGIAIVCDRSLSGWRESGDAGPPDFPSLHNLGDCIFLAGIRPRSGILPPGLGGAAVIESAAIQLGLGATEAAVLGNVFNTLWTELVVYVLGHTHQVVGVTPGPTTLPTTPPQVGLAAIPPAPPTPNTSIVSALSTKVKIGS